MTSKRKTKRSQHSVARARAARKPAAAKRREEAGVPTRPGLPGGTRQENRRRRIEDLHRAATELFVAQGMQAVSVEELAKAAGLSKAGFYRYYPSIDALVAELFAPVSRAVDDAGATAGEGLRSARKRDQLVAVYLRLGIALTALVASEQALVRLYLQEVRGPAAGVRRPVAALASRLDELVLELTHAAHAHGLLRAIDPELSAQAVLGLVEHVLFRALRTGTLVSEAERLPALIALVLEGVARADRT
jgi:AcrR family transcriptional regulator